MWGKEKQRRKDKGRRRKGGNGRGHAIMPSLLNKIRKKKRDGKKKKTNTQNRDDDLCNKVGGGIKAYHINGIKGRIRLG